MDNYDDKLRNLLFHALAGNSKADEMLVQWAEQAPYSEPSWELRAEGWNTQLKRRLV